MNKDYFNQSVEFLKFQRNVFLALSFLLVICVLVLSGFLFTKSERVVVVPPNVEKEFWVESSKVSPTYLEQHAQYLSQLLLGKTLSSAKTQREILLRHVSPELYASLKTSLLKEEQLLRKEGASYSFFPVLLHVDPISMQVMISGDKVAYLGSQKTSVKRENYILGFVVSGGRLLLSSVTSKESRDAQVDANI